MLLSSFPENIAGIRVLLRLLMPRHPPAALSSLTTKILRKLFIAAFSSPVCKIYSSSATYYK
jgi:hypothetical protein